MLRRSNYSYVFSKAKLKGRGAGAIKSAKIV